MYNVIYNIDRKIRKLIYIDKNDREDCKPLKIAPTNRGDQSFTYFHIIKSVLIKIRI